MVSWMFQIVWSRQENLSEKNRLALELELVRAVPVRVFWNSLKRLLTAGR